MTPPRFHQFVRHATEKESIGLLEIRDGEAMNCFVGVDCTMVAAPVQRNVDRIPKWSHGVTVSTMAYRSNPMRRCAPPRLVRSAFSRARRVKSGVNPEPSLKAIG